MKEKKCYICKSPIDRNLDERRFEQNDFLYGIFTHFDSNNWDCKVKRKTRYLCGGCANTVNFLIDHVIEQRENRKGECGCKI